MSYTAAIETQGCWADMLVAFFIALHEMGDPVGAQPSSIRPVHLYWRCRHVSSPSPQRKRRPGEEPRTTRAAPIR